MAPVPSAEGTGWGAVARLDVPEKRQTLGLSRDKNPLTHILVTTVSRCLYFYWKFLPNFRQASQSVRTYLVHSSSYALAFVGIRTLDPLTHIVVTTVSRCLYFYWTFLPNFRQASQSVRTYLVHSSSYAFLWKLSLGIWRGGPLLENLVLNPQAVCFRRRMVKNITVVA